MCQDNQREHQSVCENDLGVTTDESMGSDIRVLLVLTGVKSEQIHGASLHTQMRNLRNRTVEFVS